MSILSPPKPTASGLLDLQANAVTLATRLDSLYHFLETATELLSCQYLSSSDFRRHSRKIVTLIEIARKTLTASGISVFLYVPCPSTAVRHKTAYIDLLHMLKRRREDVDKVLEDRVKHLLSPLNSRFIMIPTGTTSPPQGQRSAASAKLHGLMTEPGPSTSAAFDIHAKSMPPPDAMSPACISQSRGTQIPRHSFRGRRLWNVDIQPARQRRPSVLERENTLPSPRIIRPPPRRFGIFCTPKMSMHQYREPVKHVRTIVPLKE